MLNINLQNVEELVFYNKKIQKLLPEFKYFFDAWALSKQTPVLRALGIKSISDFLNSLEQNHINILEQHFKTKVKVDKMSYSILKNYNWESENVEEGLNKTETFSNLFMYREGNQVYISFWR